MRRALPALALAGSLLIGSACASPAPEVSPGASIDVPPTAPPNTPVNSFEQAYGVPQPVDVSVELSPITFSSTVSVENGGFFTLCNLVFDFGG